jgi:hypothetical protein
MVTVKDFSALVSAIHAATIRPSEWDVATTNIAQMFDGTTAVLVVADGDSRINKSAPLLPAEAASSYAEYYCRLDHVLAATEQRQVGVVRTAAELVSPHVNTEFHTDWIRRYGFEDGLFPAYRRVHPASFPRGGTEAIRRVRHERAD